ncbi:hypothetical protein LTR62_005717 [Meristemomyces frigidus]|uniref:Major facilitator superfamily (MFS) profile domain-containing protein n=1 Tax=Meristemomyces frigidus TaxID=1508187 RepID=A0AAN7YF02_9PEZI|nr:hypothetical protein LTR62_005717 [Meristemomyces frigidus]
MELSLLESSDPPYRAANHDKIAPVELSTVMQPVEAPTNHQSHPVSTLPTGRATIVIAMLSSINFVNSLSNGMITVALPAIATDIALDSNLLVWPTSVTSLTSGTCVLVAGAVADVVGPRSINLAGCLLMGCFVLACGLSQTGIQLVLFRAMQGIASALTVPTGISIVSTSVADGRPRNLGFGCLGLSQPLGFSVGLVLGGVFVDSIGWRAGFYVGGALSFILFVMGIWALPSVQDPSRSSSQPSTLRRLARDVDWVGAGMASASIALFSYVLAMLSANIDSIRSAGNIVTLIISMALVPAFVFWVGRQERKGQPALIPNSIWKNAAFTSICLMVLLSYAVQNSIELFSSLFFQKVQGTTALGASLRLLPNLLCGAALDLCTGLLVNKVSATTAVLVSSGLATLSPLLMALINPHWPYWYDAFPAQLLAPISGDVLFTIGLIIVSASFPAHTQGLAGAVFNTVAQIGTSVGLTVLSVIATSVTKNAGSADGDAARAIMKGYRASFWALFAMMILVCVIGGVGLRKLGKVGHKRD